LQVVAIGQDWLKKQLFPPDCSGPLNNLKQAFL